MIRISACLVVFNEEENIERCLKSLSGAVDEIIVIHDGVCQDKTLEIAEKYQAKIFVRPHIGMMEMHLIFALQQSSGDWVLRIDADEFLTPELQQNLRLLATEATNTKTGAYSFRWNQYFSGEDRFLVSRERKTIFFRKADLYWFTMPHLAWQTRGLIKNTNYVLGHKVRSNSFQEIWNKRKLWIKLQAQYLLKDFAELDNFQASRQDWQNFYFFTRSQALNPLWPIIKFFKSVIEELSKGTPWKLIPQRAYYNFLLGIYLFKRALKLKIKRF